MPIGGSATELNITGAKLKVSGGVQVSGSIVYTDDATGFGGVTAQIDNNNTLNITSGKLTGVTKIERATAATINAITHTNVNNNTTIHLALKNTSTAKDIFIILGTFASDDTVKVNYTDNYLIGPGETGMLTLRKVNGVLSLFVREMFSSKATSFDATDNSPFYIKDGVNYKYPLYKFAGTGLTSEVIQGTTYYKPTAGITTKSRPPKGIPENVTPPSASAFNIGNNTDMTTLEYSVLGVSSNFDFASITDNGGTTHARFLLTDGEASGTFTESGASSGDSYKLFIEKTNTNLTDTVSVTTQNNVTQTIAFHHGPFSASDYSSAYSTVGAAATAGFVYSDTVAGTYAWGTLGTPILSVTNTTYTWTPASTVTADVLMVAGGGGGGGFSGGGGAGGVLFNAGETLSGMKVIVIGDGGVGGIGYSNGTAMIGNNGINTTFTGLTSVVGGGGGGGYSYNGNAGGSGGGAGFITKNGGSATSGQGYNGGNSSGESSGGGGGAGGTGFGGSSHSYSGNGGLGVNYTSTFGTTYGDGGWFASGGGGGVRRDSNSSMVIGVASQGGGANGWWTHVTKADDAQKHTGGGGGGGGFMGSTTNIIGGDGGSGIVLIKYTTDVTTGKKIAKVNDITLDPTNESNVLISTQGTGISTVTYSVNGGSEVSTPVSQLSVAHGLSENVTATLLAYALDASSARLGVKLSKSITSVYGYETFTITQHTNAGSTLSITGNGTDNITSVYKNSGSSTWDAGFYTPTFTAPITLEFNKTAPSSTSSSDVRIGITDTPSTDPASNSMLENMSYYFRSRQTSIYQVSSSKGLSVTNGTAWDGSKKHYIVYKTDGGLEFWNGGDLKFSVSAAYWGTGKSVRFETAHLDNNSTLNNTMTNIRMKRREWDGTKYIN
jgi:hypothetical protein